MLLYLTVYAYKKVWGWIGTFRKYNIVAHKLHKNWKARAQDLKFTFKQYVIYRNIYYAVAPFKGLAKIAKIPKTEKRWKVIYGRG